MYDSGASSNIITKGIMQRLGLKVTRPYHNLCAMDSREIETHGIIIDFPVADHLFRLWGQLHVP
jgi:hypothetical protein